MSQDNENIVGEYGSSQWKGRGRLAEMVAELERQKETKLDFVADSRSMRPSVLVRVDQGSESSTLGHGVMLMPNGAQEKELLGEHGLPMKPQAVRQICARVEPKIPAPFWDQLLKLRPYRAEDLLGGLMVDKPKRWLVRALDDQVRAVLSNSYRVLDHYDVAFECLDVARKNGGEVLEASLSDRSMKIKLISRQLFDAIDARRDKAGNWYIGGLGSPEYLSKVGAKSEGELPGGPGTVFPSVTISNSETGHGGFDVRLGIMCGICFNLATVEDVLAKVHLGGKLDVGLYSDETKALESRAVYARARDAVRGAFDPERFKAIVAKCKSAASVEIESPKIAVEHVVKANDLTEDSKDAILEHFLSDYDRTAFGLSQAVARHAQDHDDPDVASGLEDVAGKIIASPAVVAA